MVEAIRPKRKCHICGYEIATGLAHESDQIGWRHSSQKDCVSAMLVNSNPQRKEEIVQ